MTIPIWSIITLGTELIVSGAVYTLIYLAYTRGTFYRRTAYGVLAYEVLFNISYMLSRLLSGTHDGTAQVYTPYETGLAIFHGIFSLIMFVALLAFFITAARRYATGENYFRAHPRTTLLFCAAWLVSILSGILFFVELYVL